MATRPTRLDPHPRFDALLEAARRCRSARAERWEGAIFRACDVEWAGRADLLTGLGSYRHGARWNPPGVHGVYGSQDPHTALAELGTTGQRYGIPAEQSMLEFMPLVLAGVSARLEVVLDFRKPAVVRAFGSGTIHDLLAVPWRDEMDAGREPLTQALGRALFEAGFQGLLVPSRVPPPPGGRGAPGLNVVVFRRNVAARQLRIHKPSKLPRRLSGA